MRRKEKNEVEEQSNKENKYKKQINNKKQKIIIIIILIFIILIFTFFHKQQNSSQISPHFLKNKLQNLLNNTKINFNNYTKFKVIKSEKIDLNGIFPEELSEIDLSFETLRHFDYFLNHSSSSPSACSSLSPFLRVLLFISFIYFYFVIYYEKFFLLLF